VNLGLVTIGRTLIHHMPNQAPRAFDRDRLTPCHAEIFRMASKDDLPRSPDQSIMQEILDASISGSANAIGR
jgi:hypothetical protein